MGKKFADNSLYEQAMEEWHQGLALADRFSGEEESIGIARENTYAQINKIYAEAKKLYDGGEYIEAKKLLEDGAKQLEKEVN